MLRRGEYCFAASLWRGSDTHQWRWSKPKVAAEWHPDCARTHAMAPTRTGSEVRRGDPGRPDPIQLPLRRAGRSACTQTEALNVLDYNISRLLKTKQEQKIKNQNLRKKKINTLERQSRSLDSAALEKLSPSLHFVDVLDEYETTNSNLFPFYLRY